MNDERRIRTDEGYLTALGERLGQERMEQFIAGQGNVQAMALFLVMAVTAAPQAEYSDAALAVLIEDAEDLRGAANEWADSCIALAEAWRAQREADPHGNRPHHTASSNDAVDAEHGSAAGQMAAISDRFK